jgi:hypothetical protein
MRRNLLFLFCAVALLAGPWVSASAEDVIPQNVEQLFFLSDNLKIPDNIKPEALVLYHKGNFLLEALRKGQSFWGESKEAAGHEHVVTVNGAGKGRTDEVDGHFHRIENGLIGPALRIDNGEEIKGSGAHTHELKGLETSADLTTSKPLKASDMKFTFGPVTAGHFNYVLGITDKGHGGHQHVVPLHFFGNGQSSQNAEHRHLFSKYIDKGAIKGIRNRKAIRADNFHVHKKITWCYRKFWLADGGDYIASQLKAATKKDSKFDLAYYQLAIIYQWIREFDLARKAIDKAVRGIPNFYESLVERADVFSWMMEHGKAFNDYRRALRISPSYAHTYYCMGLSNLRQAKHAEARKNFVSAAEGLAKEVEHLKALEKEHPKSLALKEKIREMEGETKGAQSFIKQIDGEKSFPKSWSGEHVYFGETKHYIVKTTMSQEVADFFGERLELAYDLFSIKFVAKRPNKIKIRVYLFRDRKAYLKTGAPPQSGGYSSPLLQKIVFPINGKDIAQNGFSPGRTPTAKSTVETRNVLVHEAFHQFLDKYLEMAPQTFNEGCADYFAPAIYSEEGRSRKPKLEIKTNTWRLKSIQQMIKADSYVPLVPFIKMTKAEMYDRRYMGMHYAQSWGFFFFMWEYKVNQKRKYWDTLERYYKALRKGKGLNRAYKDSFGRLNMKKVEEEWKDYVQYLK